jgi:hypothetical protein
MLAILALPNHPTPYPPASTQFHPRSPKAPKDRQRVTTYKWKNPASQPGLISFDSRVAPPPSAVSFGYETLRSITANKIRIYFITISRFCNKKIL